LRYDLTVPLRYVVHQNDINFHSSGIKFNRFGEQIVRKRTFQRVFQCDADVVGSKSLWQEVELVQLYDTVLLWFRRRNNQNQ
jgi:histidyl-tRNA synthetase